MPTIEDLDKRVTALQQWRDGAQKRHNRKQESEDFSIDARLDALESASHTEHETAEAPDLTALLDTIAALSARILALETLSQSGGGGTLPSGTVRGLRLIDPIIEGEVRHFATKATGSRCYTVIIPKAIREQQAYPFFPRVVLQEDNGSETFMYGKVAHHIGTNHNDHASEYVNPLPYADRFQNQDARLSVAEVDTFRPTSTRRYRFENLRMQGGDGDKEAILDFERIDIGGKVYTITRASDGTVKAS